LQHERRRGKFKIKLYFEHRRRLEARPARPGEGPAWLRHMLLAPSFICPLACNSQVELFPASSQGASSTALPAAASGCAAKHFFAAKFVKEPLPVRLQTSRPSSSASAAVHSFNKAVKRHHLPA
jgi:hypothetical protein